ncbi:MAG: HU family DNA-binding protein [Muribaculaceae bacterium]|nr:HU family DNA-binding protein [Muribaculaceae bacterium]
MDNKQYITRLSRRATLNYKETQQLVSSAITMITEVLAQDDLLAIPAFGTFETEKKDEYIAVDENSGQRMLYPPSVIAKFTPGTILTKSISNQQ